MHTKSLTKRLLRIDKIAIENVSFEISNDEEILVIKARPMSRDTNRCPKCSKRCKGYDSSSKVRRWRSLDFGSYRVYIEAFAPRIECLCLGAFEVRGIRYFIARTQAEKIGNLSVLPHGSLSLWFSLTE